MLSFLCMFNVCYGRPIQKGSIMKTNWVHSRRFMIYKLFSHTCTERYILCAQNRLNFAAAAPINSHYRFRFLHIYYHICSSGGGNATDAAKLCCANHLITLHLRLWPNAKWGGKLSKWKKRHTRTHNASKFVFKDTRARTRSSVYKVKITR